ncbi:MAG: hypothetical protein ACW98K_18325 [Candidatus Kariarchaeaceae archaeon]
MTKIPDPIVVNPMALDVFQRYWRCSSKTKFIALHNYDVENNNIDPDRSLHSMLNDEGYFVRLAQETNLFLVVEAQETFKNLKRNMIQLN